MGRNNNSCFFFPTDSIKDYFGETIALYFGFLGFYSVSLVPPVLLVVVFALSGAHEQTKNTVFAILNLIWATVFLEAWKRRCAEISFKWGTLTSGIGENIFSQLTVELTIINSYFLLITSFVFGGQELIVATTISFLTLLWVQIHIGIQAHLNLRGSDLLARRNYTMPKCVSIEIER